LASGGAGLGGDRGDGDARFLRASVRRPSLRLWPGAGTRTDLFAGSPTPLEYLRRLADAGNEWSNERPETKPAVAQRIRELRVGCQRLIDHQHAPLSPIQDAALKQLCHKWLGQFNEVLAELEQDQRTPREARESIDEIVAKLTRRLRSGKLES
jgi:hypothetical protein